MSDGRRLADRGLIEVGYLFEGAPFGCSFSPSDSIFGDLRLAVTSGQALPAPNPEPEPVQSSPVPSVPYIFVANRTRSSGLDCFSRIDGWVARRYYFQSR